MTGSRTSLLQDLVAALPHLRPQLYFKSSLVALSHAIEDQVLAEQGSPIVFANFQKERYYQQEAHRYARIARIAKQVFVLAVPETRFAQEITPYNRIALDGEDPLAQEWHVIALDPSYSLCLIAREKLVSRRPDHARQFEGIWSFDRRIALQAATLLIPKILAYRPDLTPLLTAIQEEWQRSQGENLPAIDPSPFTERLITYLQVGQYKLQRAYQAVQARENQERLLNDIARLLQASTDLSATLTEVLRLLASHLPCSRCLFYSYHPDRPTLPIQAEFAHPDQPSLVGIPWPVAEHPWMQAVITTRQMQVCPDTRPDPHPKFWQAWQIGAWIGIPIVFQDRLLAILELHHPSPQEWQASVLELLQRVAAQIALALMQAEAYQQLQELNQQLAALDQAKSDLIAVTGHELRTPLSTIQVCLESLATDPDMPASVRQEMLDTALQDAERLRRLVQDFLTLSRLESGRVEWHEEPQFLVECVELAISNIRARRRRQPIPRIDLAIAPNLPLVNTDGEWLVEVLSKLIDNACKFTPDTGRVQISAIPRPNHHLPPTAVELVISDTGRGIDPDRIPLIFERFTQAEGSLRRTVGGTGLGLAICREVIATMGGEIWAESAGANQGSTFHVVIPIQKPNPQPADSNGFTKNCKNS